MLATAGKIRRSSLGGHLLSPERANTRGNGDANGRYVGLAAREANVGNMDYIERARAKISTTAKLKQSQEVFDKLCAGREKLASSRERVRHDAIKDWTFSSNITANKTRTGVKLSPWGLGNGSNAPYAGLTLHGPTRARDAIKDSTFSSAITSKKTRTGRNMSPWELGSGPNAPYAGLTLQGPTRTREVFDKLCAGREKLASSKERVRHDAIKDWTWSPKTTSKKTRTGGKLSPRGLGNGSNAPYAGLTLQGPTRTRDAIKDSTFSSAITSKKTRTGRNLSPWELGSGPNAPYAGLTLQGPTRARNVTKDSTKDSTFSPEITSNKTWTVRKLSPWGLGNESNAPYAEVTLQGPTGIRNATKDWTFCPELTSNKTRTGRNLSLWGLGDGSNAAYAGVVLQRLT